MGKTLQCLVHKLRKDIRMAELDELKKEVDRMKLEKNNLEVELRRLKNRINTISER